MPEVLIYILVGAGSLLIGVLAGYGIKNYVEKYQINRKSEEIEKRLSEIEKDANKIKNEALVKAKNQFYNEKTAVEKDLRDRRNEVRNLEKRISQKEDTLDRKLDSLDKREKAINKRERIVEQKENELEKQKTKIENELEKLADITMDDARNRINEKIESEVKQNTVKLLSKMEEELNANSDEMAKNLLMSAIERVGTNYVSDNTVSSIYLSNEELKGRIIGREGKNVRAFEVLTGVDVIVDDTREFIMLSSFDPIRREIAKRTIEQLLKDGRINPARIEEVHKQINNSFKEEILKEGDKIVNEIGILGLPAELKKYVGEMKYRFYNGQNLLTHSVETAMIGSVIAAEIKADAQIVKRAGLLHDIGKCLINNSERHNISGAEFVKKYGENQIVIDAIENHSKNGKPKYIESSIVQIADRISSERPGAKKEPVQSFINRLSNIEKIPAMFEGVTNSYAINSGREIRVFVNSNVIDDVEAKMLAKQIGEKIKTDLNYSLPLKVTLIRESRVVEAIN